MSSQRSLRLNWGCIMHTTLSPSLVVDVVTELARVCVK